MGLPKLGDVLQGLLGAIRYAAGTNRSWSERARCWADARWLDQEGRKFDLANHRAVIAAVEGRGPDDPRAEPGSGARMVANISAAHVPAFCIAAQANDPKPYKTGYDLGKYRLGGPGSVEKLKTRVMVDQALPLNAGISYDNVYFGAVELNGAGIRFYGDVCLVLSSSALPEDTPILDRNSYDLTRPPISDRINSLPASRQSDARREEAAKLRGSWRNDVGPMAALKVLVPLGRRTRRLTTGQISEGVRDDEDYIEILKNGSFAPRDLQEARFAARDAAHDALIGDRLLSGPTPRLEALVWRYRRARAEIYLRRAGVQVRVVTTSGRARD